jgi:probable rRNA maturation factor
MPTNALRRARTSPAANDRAGDRTSPAAKSPAPARLSLAIQLGDEVEQLPVSRDQLRRWVTAALESDARLALRFVGEQEGRTLNHQYRGRDYATNVLTFAYDEGAGMDEDSATEADIVICLPVLEREAQAGKIPLAHHLAHLVVHGVLHAFGHDHEDPSEAEAMEARETAILARFRLPDPYAR